MKLYLTGIAIAVLAVFVFVNCAAEKTSEPILSNHKQLTFKGDNGEAYFSPDGKHLIFQSKRDGFECDKIYMMTSDGKDMHMVSTDGGAHTCSYFSKDKDFILYSSTLHDGQDCPEVFKPANPHEYVWPLRNFEIYKADLDGSNVVALTNNDGYDAEATVHPFEEKIIFSSLRNGDMDIYTMNYEGGDIQRITHDFGYDGAAFYSPDASKIVWRAWYPETDEERAHWQESIENNYVKAVPLEIYVANADGSEKVQLTSNGATNWAPSWHPDGKRIVFASNMDDWNEELGTFGHNFELYMIDVDGKNRVRLTHNETFDAFPMFSPDGKKLVYASNRDANNPRATNVYISDFIE